MEGDGSSVNNGQVTLAQLVQEESDDFDIDIVIVWLCIVAMDMSKHMRKSIRDSILSRPEWVKEVLCGHLDRVYEVFRMDRHVFLNLCGLMIERGWLKDSRFIRIDEQVAIFLSMICHKNSNRNLCERFQRSGQTISKYFTKVLNAVLKLAKEIIVPPSFNVVLEEILMNPQHEPYFKGCVDAIDGTHVHASVLVAKQIPFRGKKGITTQNVVCACLFDMKFTFVYVGWEGFANDCRVLSAALETPHLEFPLPLPGKYYVVDSDYATVPGLFTPFKGKRYHLNDYRGTSKRPRTARELFNYNHSSLRNVIERAFVALKNRFFILKHIPSFAIRKQACVVIVCCAIYNYIRDQDKRDKNFSLYENSEYLFGPTEDEVTSDASTIEGIEINMLKIGIANEMARDHNMAKIS